MNGDLWKTNAPPQPTQSSARNRGGVVGPLPGAPVNGINIPYLGDRDGASSTGSVHTGGSINNEVMPIILPDQAPQYELLLGSDSLCDWHDLPVCEAAYGNVVQFFEAAAPRVPLCRSNKRSRGQHRIPAASSPPHTCVVPSPAAAQVQMAPIAAATQPAPMYVLKELWKRFDFPFGCEIPVKGVALNPMKPMDNALFYVPLLSALHFTVAANSLYDGKIKLPTHSDMGSTPSTPTVEELAAANGDIVWLATEKPENRPPLYDQMEMLGRDMYPALLEACNTDFTPSSWFAVLWQPIHCHNHSPQRSAGSFILYYMLNPPGQCVCSGAAGSDTHSVDAKSLQLTPSTAVLKYDGKPFRSGGVLAASSVAAPASGIPAAPGFGAAPPASSSSQCSDTSNHSPALPPSEDSGEHVSAWSAHVAEDESDEGAAWVRAPIVGMIPYRLRADVWFASKQRFPPHREQFSHVAPLFLIAAAMQLMIGEEMMSERHKPTAQGNNISAGVHNGGAVWMDFHHFTKHEKGFLSFIAAHGSS